MEAMDLCRILREEAKYWKKEGEEAERNNEQNLAFVYGGNSLLLHKLAERIEEEANVGH